MSAVATAAETELSVEQKAEKLIRDAGVEGQFPVPLEAIAQHLDYRSVAFQPSTIDLPGTDMKNVSGMIDYRSKIIYVNSEDILERQRFTLAHEIAHAALGHGDSEDVTIDYRENLEVGKVHSPKEREANQFAAALLMPRKDFLKEWIRFSGNVELLSKVFTASKQAIGIRRATVLP